MPDRDKASTEPLRLVLIAGEHSGDALGARLIDALRTLSPRRLAFKGVGAELMAKRGCPSLFPLEEIAVMGPLDILPRLPTIWHRVHQTVDMTVAEPPDALVILDSPEFTHQVAQRVRRRAPNIPIIDYVSPSVWAWRPGRARKMRRYVDHVLAILPFEPDAHRRLGGPPCSYVGHPLVEKLDWISTLDPEPLRKWLGLAEDRNVLVVLPGSRASEVRRLMEPFGEALRLLEEEGERFEVIVPAVDTVRGLIEEGLASWPMKPRLTSTEADKFAAFKLARAALAASGTVTLELALAGTPMVVGYRGDWLASSLKFLVVAPSVVLPNLVIGENVFPEYLLKDCTPENLAHALLPLLHASSERDRQVKGTVRVQQLMRGEVESPSERAARIVLAYAEPHAAATGASPLAPSGVPQRVSIGT
jgi:lipid-A-disaccharide synthase